MAEIAEDLAGDRPMLRLLQGDVDSGTTAVALYLLLAAALDGGALPGGLPSTVVGARQDDVVLLREGAVSVGRIAAVLGGKQPIRP